MRYLLIFLMCLCTQSCACLTKQERKTIRDGEVLLEDVIDIETGCKLSNCEGGSCGRGKGKDKRQIPLNITGNFTPGAK